MGDRDRLVLRCVHRTVILAATRELTRGSAQVAFESPVALLEHQQGPNHCRQRDSRLLPPSPGGLNISRGWPAGLVTSEGFVATYMRVEWSGMSLCV
ncbi:hypothetical protein MRX96_051039 [Rhipicephalus microplus]